MNKPERHVVGNSNRINMIRGEALGADPGFLRKINPIKSGKKLSVQGACDRVAPKCTD